MTTLRLWAALACIVPTLCLLTAPTCAQTPPPELPKPIDVPPPATVPPYIPFPQLPAPALDEMHNRIGIAQQMTRARKLQARILWIDATANMDAINTADKIAALVLRIKKAGFNTVVLDVKPIVGYTLYPSQYAPKLTEWLYGRTIPADFDPVPVFVARAHDAGLQVVASMNAFSEGHRNVQKGPGYDHPEWQTILYEPKTMLRSPAPGAQPFPVSDRPDKPGRTEQEIAVYSDLSNLPKPKPAAGTAAPTAATTVVLLDGSGSVVAQIDGAALAALAPKLPAGGAALVGSGAAGDYLRQFARVGDRLTLEVSPQFVPISQRPEQQVPLMVNPNRADVQQRILDMVAEVTRKYAVDGIIFDDRFRYAGINADFSDESRALFEKYVGRPVRWPEEIFHYEVGFPSMERRVVPGPLYDAWLTWRALTLRNWLARAVTTAKSIRPTVMVSTYTGSWYGDYPALGVNWAADDFVAGFRFLNPSYQKTGYAGLVDWITTGCYYPQGSIAKALAVGRSPGATVEAAGQLCNRAVNDQTWVYAGIQIDTFRGDMDALRGALQAACASTQGVMVFDLSHFTDPVWSVFEEAFREPAVAPHAVAGLLAQLRRDHAAHVAMGIPDPPVIVFNGIPGTGL